MVAGTNGLGRGELPELATSGEYGVGLTALLLWSKNNYLVYRDFENFKKDCLDWKLVKRFYKSKKGEGGKVFQRCRDSIFRWQGAHLLTTRSHELIAHASNRYDKFWVLRILLQLQSQAANVRIYCPC